jgi:hypothetical protein
MVNPMVPVWKRFRFDAARKRGGSLNILGKFPSYADVDIRDLGKINDA